MDGIGTGLVYADQAAAEDAASKYRALFVETVDLLEDLAKEIDSLRLARMVEKLQTTMRNVNF
ncbi:MULTISPECIES: hypothetical protein [Pseudomonadota]|uniref:hypothetical protein n=1 Tax=Pseudomonadota TaxID=1224 RepID=UPI0006406335|nr:MULTISPECIES: hypothetical protein [Pseudomonadota]